MARAPRSFSSLAGFLPTLAAAVHAAGEAPGVSLIKAAALVKRTAKAAMGHDNWEPGPPFLSPWPDLSEETQDDKSRKGFTGAISEYDTNLRTTATRESIKSEVHGKKGFSVGSDSDVMQFIELGTVYQPPRSVLGGALARSMPRIRRMLGEDVKAALLGDEVNVDDDGEGRGVEIGRGRR